ncbi:MAG: hypothetical protein KIS61_09420 [Candidatus Eremiobacteraeota bacterium]|nr:hypothetical protein [Candidatus Eremiobacteraeota bacterium]
MEPTPETISRHELRYYAADWRAYSQRFGYLDLRKKRWTELKTAGLGRFLRSKGVTVEKARDGNRPLYLRLNPALWEWVEQQGGGAFVKAKLEQLALSELGALAYGWVRVKTVTTFRLLGTMEDQRLFVLWKRGSAHLFLSPEREPERTARGYRTEWDARERLVALTGCEIRDLPPRGLLGESKAAG